MKSKYFSLVEPFSFCHLIANNVLYGWFSTLSFHFSFKKTSFEANENFSTEKDLFPFRLASTQLMHLVYSKQNSFVLLLLLVVTRQNSESFWRNVNRKKCDQWHHSDRLRVDSIQLNLSTTAHRWGNHIYNVASHSLDWITSLTHKLLFTN